MARTVNVTHAFTLSIVRDGQLVKERIPEGLQELPDDVADHWYAKAHLAGLPVDEVEASAADEAKPAKQRKK